MEACELLTPAGTPLGFGEMEVWGDSIPRVLRTLGCMTQARWACVSAASLQWPLCIWKRQPENCSSRSTTTPKVHNAVARREDAKMLNQGSEKSVTTSKIAKGM